MSEQRCPACGQSVSGPLSNSSRDAVVDYYRCDRCAHVWTTTKDGLSIVKHVTPLKVSPLRRRA
jgi:hypothetical protein